MSLKINRIFKLILIAILPITSSCRNQINGWFIFDWGEKKENVMYVLNNLDDVSIDSLSTQITIKNFKMYGQSFMVILEFDNSNRISKVKMFSEDSPTAFNRLAIENNLLKESDRFSTVEDAYKNLSQTIVNEYGKPDNVKELLIGDNFENKTLTWNFKKTLLELETNDLFLILTFTSKKYSNIK
jgi:hypothetical protein